MAKKTLLLLLALFCAASCLFGCRNEGEGGEPSTASNGEDTRPGNKPGISKDYYVDYETDNLPDELDYGGYEFNIICDSSHTAKAFMEKPTGDTITQSVYERMHAVETRLGVLLMIDSQEYVYPNHNAFIEKMDISAMGGQSYDLALAYPLLPAVMIERGLICDLVSTEYFESTKPWWSDTLLDKVAIDGKIYFTGDNSSWNNLRNMMAIFVDKDIFAGKHPELSVNDLYDLVEDGAWTMEKMFELVEGTYESTDGAGEADENDIYGLSSASRVWLEGYFYSAGFTTVEKEENGNLRITLRDDGIVTFTDWFSSRYNSSPDIYPVDSAQYRMFLDRRVMMYQSVLSMVEQELEQEFTVLPMPMYQSELQGGRYYTHFCNYYDVYAIPSSVAVADRARSSAVLECLASEAYRRVAPTYFDLYLKSRNASDDRMADMYDVIRESVVYDIGYVYGFLFSKADGSTDMPIYSFRSALNNTQSLGAIWTAEKHQQYSERLDEIIGMVRDAAA